MHVGNYECRSSKGELLHKMIKCNMKDMKTLSHEVKESLQGRKIKKDIVGIATNLLPVRTMSCTLLKLSFKHILYRSS